MEIRIEYETKMQGLSLLGVHKDVRVSGRSRMALQGWIQPIGRLSGPGRIQPPEND